MLTKFDLRTNLRSAMSAMKVLLMVFVLIASQALAGAPSALAIDPDSPSSPTRSQPGIGNTTAPQRALPETGTLLQDRFGVTLGLLAPWGGGANYSFDPGTFAPTLNAGTADWIEADWYGNWSTSDIDYHTTIRGSYPSGGEWYDVEALYFDNDATNFYIAVVTSMPHYHYDGTGGWGVGVYERREGVNAWIRPGDLSLNLALGTPRQERNGTTWSYDFGVDIVHDNRDYLGNTVGMRDNNLGAKLYRTVYDLGGGNYENPSTSDWYTSGPGYNVEAYWEHTNFDPFYSKRPFPQYLGQTTVSYYKYSFADGHLENNASTYVIEVTIPRTLLGDDNPGPGEKVGIQWVGGCRNDGNSGDAVIDFTADVDFEMGDAPDSSNHAGVPMSNQTGGGPGSAQFPTVADTASAGGDTPGMCHKLSSSGLRLGTAVSAESDADLATDEDGQTNIDPAADEADRDADDGLTFPLYWIDGTQTSIHYTVTAPASATAGDRYVNIWVDWNRDGDWADESAACVHGTRDEHVLTNEVVNVPGDVAPGSTATFEVQVNPCQPVLMDRAWVRITLSEEPISTTNDDGRGPGHCFAEGETEDYLYDPTLEYGDAPDSTNNDGQAMTAYSLAGGTVEAHFPTIFKTTSGLPGPCHIQQLNVTPILGSAVTVENTDADRWPDADPLLNILPLTNDPDNDGADDGLTLPVEWQDGTPVDIQYVVTMPAGGAAVPWYVNVWFDWNRDGDWDDTSVTCRNGHSENEQVVPNQEVNVAPGSSQPFIVSIDPCNPVADGDAIWIRITLSNEQLMASDGSGPSQCMYGGETEDYFGQFSPTAVDLASFTATPQAQSILVEWETVSEIDNLGFNLYRATSLDAPQIKLNDSLIPSQGPGSPIGYVYSFVDRRVQFGQTYYYWLEAVDIYGLTARYGPVSALVPLPIGVPSGRP